MDFKVVACLFLYSEVYIVVLDAFFSILWLDLIAIPTGIKILNWLATILANAGCLDGIIAWFSRDRWFLNWISMFLDNYLVQ